jgi:hypothetical protein
MKKVIINPTSNTPKVVLDPDNNIFEISGESRPFDVPTFYQPLLTWLDEFSHYLSKMNGGIKPIDFIFNLEYFNSLSAKYILDLCKKLSKIHIEGFPINVRWQYEEGDDYMLETGQEMSKISKLPFEYEMVKS